MAKAIATHPIFPDYSASIQQRLEKRLVRLPSGCIEWGGFRKTTGYGLIKRGSRTGGMAMTHRVAWEMANGPIPDGLLICHHCDNPPCCNIDHLFLGTYQDNTRDMWSKGRGVRGSAFVPGERNIEAFLSDDEVRELREYARQCGNYAEAGRRYGLTKAGARAICIGLRRGITTPLT